MTEPKINERDFELTLPQSLREVVLGELHNEASDALNEGRQPEPKLSEDEIKALLLRVYQRIESEALQIYHSSEPEALKSWALSNILKDEVITELNLAVATRLIEPILDWQQQTFDPIKHYKDELDGERKAEGTIAVYLTTAARFVGMVGRKKHYSDDEIRLYLDWSNKNFPNQNTYYHDCKKLLRFLQTLPGGEGRKLPRKLPKPSAECYQPTVSPEELEALVWGAVTQNIEASLVVRILVASIYGGRISELAQLCSDDFVLDGKNSTVKIRTKKGGVTRPQPLPESLLPLFDVEIKPMASYALHRKFQDLCREVVVMVERDFDGNPIKMRAGKNAKKLKLQKKVGFHCVRRRVVTAVSEVEKSDISVHDFMRWARPRQFAMLSTYRQTPTEITDMEILEQHPIVALWKTVLPYVLACNDNYTALGKSQHNHAQEGNLLFYKM